MSSMFASVRSAVFGVIAVLVLGIPSGAIAQVPVSSFEQLPTWLRVGDTVYVTDAAGREHKGTIGGLSASSLSLLVGGTPQDFRKENISTITRRRPDSLGNGALIGLAVGAGLATVGVAALCAGDESCDAGGAILVVGLYGGIGAGIGVGIDALTPGKKVLVYSAPSASSAARISVSPLVSPGRGGLAVSVRF